MKEIYIQRELEEIVNKYLDKKEIIAIVGARQCGKTTLMKNIFKNLKKAIFISFDEREKLSLFDNDIESFIELYVKNFDYLFIDEFQYSKEGGKKLKYIYDSHKIKIIISGSSVSELSIQSIKYLVGRIFIFTLYPFSFSEFLQYKNKDLYSLYSKNKKFSEEVIGMTRKLYEEFIIYGGYPRVVLSKSKEEKEVVLRNIYNTYLLKEIREILGLKDEDKLSKLMHAISLQIGSLINYNELSKIADMNYKEVVDNLNILKKTFVILESRPFYANKRKELSKNPKFYFLDNGFRNIIISNFQKLDNRADRGQINENFASSEIAKSGLDIKYWRTKSKAEIDFVIEKPGKVMPIEVKSDLRDFKITKSVYSFTKKYKIKEAFILSEGLDKTIKTEFGKVHFRPIFTIKKLI